MVTFNYYPIVPTDTEETDYSPLFPSINEKQTQRSHRYYLEEIVNGYYVLRNGKAVAPLDEDKITIHCPLCGDALQQSTSKVRKITLYTCQCRFKRKETTMSNYDLKATKGSNTLIPISTSFTDEYADRLELHLREELIEDSTGRIRSRYRLHASKPHTIEMALAYNITCPKCMNTLKQIGRCRNFHELGLYYCPECEKH